jgi:uncharacterized protein
MLLNVITDPWFYALAVPVVMLVGITKGGFLSGLGVLGVPLLALKVPPVMAAAIMLPILIGMDCVSVWSFRKTVHWGHLNAMLPGCLIGTALAWATAHWVSDSVIRLLVGAIALGSALDWWLRVRPRVAGGKPNPLIGNSIGAIAGFTSFVSHTGGPVVQVYLLPQNLPSTLYVGTTVVLFAVLNAVKVPPYLMLGQLTWTTLATSLVLLPLAAISTSIGVWCVRNIPQDPFYKLAYATLLVVGVKLVYDGVTGILA